MLDHAKGRFAAAAGLALVLAAPAQVDAQTGRTYDDPREMRMLPQYCKYTQDFRRTVPGGSDPNEIARWEALMGPTFIHMHHYCWGLMATNRASFASSTPQERNSHLGASIREFDYVIQRATPGFGLLPEIYTKKGENLIRLGRGPEGVGVLQGAIDLKPDYWEPYAVLSDYYRDSGAPAKARDWAQKGLAAAPNTRALERRLTALGGPHARGTN